MVSTYKDLVVWQKSMELIKYIYELTEKLPEAEKFALTSQIRRSAISIPSNISEGKYRGSNKEFKRFLLIAFGSGAELETQLEIVKMLKLIENTDLKHIESLLAEVMKMLNKLINKMAND